MVYIDWTCSVAGANSSCSLDGTTKYAGTSSFRARVHTQSGVSSYSKLQHNTFSQPQAQLIFWAYYTVRFNNIVRPYPGHTSYGEVPLSNSATGIWERFRVTFWYDAGTNTKWGRGERWNGSAWIQIGGDISYGAGSPANGSIYLKAFTNTGGAASYEDYWFDELEVYS